jgi:NSS family neurotransmitter:Na+ symporter
VPAVILPYYCAIGGWVLKYFIVFLTGNGESAAADSYFSSFISGSTEPIIVMLIFALAVALIIYLGVNKGIEGISKVLMPLLLLIVIGISIYSLTINYTDADGVTRTGMQGLKILLVPDIKNLTVKDFFNVLVDAMGQLFFSLSVAMGILIAYGSYVNDDTNLVKSINQIEIVDTLVAVLAGVMIIPAVYTFMGTDGMSAQGPGLMFISLPKVFAQMGTVGNIVGCLFFAMVFFAALTSAISVMEAVVSSFMDAFHISRTKATIIEGTIAIIGGIIVCFGYNKLYFEIKLPNGSIGQILDLLDYISNNALMPIVALSTCILIGWVVKPKTVIDEVEKSGVKMNRKGLYVVMIKYIAPILLFILLLKSLGILNVI